MLQCWHACAVDKYNKDLPLVLYCSDMMYKYDSNLGFFTNKKQREVKDIHNEVFKNIPHFIKNCLYVSCLQDIFVM